MLAEFTAITQTLRSDLPPRYYTKRRVRFIISPAPSTGWTVVRAGDGDGIFLPIPTVYRAGIKPLPMLIADTAEYVLGLPKNGETKATRDAATRRADYNELVEQFAAANPDDSVAQQLLAFVHSAYPAMLAEQVAAMDGTSSDLVAISINGVWAHDTPQAQVFWTGEVARRKGTGVDAVCSVCGSTAPALASLPESIPASAIPVVDGAGRSTLGRPTQLVSINNAAQGRNGIIQLANTPICPDCGGDAVAGLVHLLGEERSRRRNRDSVLVWWSNDRALEDENPFESVDRPKPAVVHNLLKKLNNPPDNFRIPSAARRFRAVTLAANKSRVVIRDHIDLSLEELGGNLTAWFEDHRIDAGLPDTDSVYVGLWLMAVSTGRPSGNDRYLPDTGVRGIEQHLLACALRGAPPPISLLPHLLHRITHDGVIDRPRAALVRLCLRRSPIPSPEEATMPGLNVDGPLAYQCGRLFRVLENIQQTAIPEINATLVDRNRAITRNPAALRNLVENSRSHLKRLNRSEKTKPAAYALEKRLDEVLERVEWAGFPARFSVNEQGQFVLGYHHQRSWDRRQREAAAKAKRDRGGSDDLGTDGPSTES